MCHTPRTMTRRKPRRRPRDKSPECVLDLAWDLKELYLRPDYNRRDLGRVLVAMRCAGFTPEDIAQAFNLSVDTTNGLLSIWGVDHLDPHDQANDHFEVFPEAIKELGLVSWAKGHNFLAVETFFAILDHPEPLR